MTLPALAAGTELGFPAWLQVTHFLNFLFIGLLIRSGWEVVSTHPRMYWRNDCGPGTEWIRFTKRKVPREVGAYTARDDECSLSPLISLPGRKSVGLGRHWHGVVTMLWIMTGVAYLVLLFATGQWRRIVPTSWDIFPQAWDSLTTYLTFNLPPLEHYQPYDSLQKLMYFVVVFIAAPLMILTGPCLSPSVVGAYPWYPKIFGGRQAARSIHFLGMAFYCVFIVMHVALVFIVYPTHGLTHMMLGTDDPSLFPQAVIRVVIGIIAVVAIWLLASYWSLADKRRAQRILVGAGEPFRRVFLGHLKSRQRGHYKEKDISPYHWTNGRYPTPDESPEWTRLRADGFRDYRLEVKGRSGDRVELSLDDIRAMPDQVQITMHTCMQGWTGIAKWQGVRLRDVLALVDPGPDANYLMFTSYGYAQSMHGGKPLEPFYTCMPKEFVYEDETILAYGMNDQPLPDPFGAPLRLRVESIHGYKMVKWLRSIEWIDDYSKYGDGMGGTREDSGYQAINARI